jgi:hypothetical protein
VHTPPLSGVSKNNGKIRFGGVEVEETAGEKPKRVPIHEFEQEKSKLGTVGKKG